jgi:hypothetical protein
MNDMQAALEMVARMRAELAKFRAAGFDAVQEQAEAHYLRLASRMRADPKLRAAFAQMSAAHAR